jgi:hypothetical protein
MKKIKNNEMRRAILDDLHIVMYMSIEPSESIEVIVIHGKNFFIENFTQHLSNDSWI